MATLAAKSITSPSYSHGEIEKRRDRRRSEARRSAGCGACWHQIGGWAPAFALRGEGPEGTIALSAGAPGWDFEADIPAGAWARAVRIAETDARGHTIARDWRVAALEYPSALAARQALEGRTA
jgi:hypothetical protein